MTHPTRLVAALGGVALSVATLASCMPAAPDDTRVRAASAALLIDPVAAPAPARLAPGSGPPARLRHVPAPAGDETHAVLIEVEMGDVPDFVHDPASKGARSALRLRQEALIARLPVEARRRARTFEHTPYLAARLSADAIDGLRQDPRVVRVIPDGQSQTTLDDSIELIGADITIDGGADGDGAIVAIIDTGVDRDHPMLEGRVVHEGCTARAGMGCPNGITGAGAAAPCVGPTEGVPGCGHGTHVAGIAAGDGFSLTGVAPAAEIIAMQVFHRVDDEETCNGRPTCLRADDSDIMHALDRVIGLREAGWNIAAVNMSLGNDQGHFNPCVDDPRAPLVTRLRQLGVTTVISSGNDGFDWAVSAPGCIPNAITVGNSTKADNVAGSSNGGPLVDLFAPGTHIDSAEAGGGVTTKSGTSMAAPHVAGAIAALRAHAPDASLAVLEGALVETGVGITDPNTHITTPRIDLTRAVEHLARTELGPLHRIVNRAGAQCRGVDGAPRYTSHGYAQNDTGAESELLCPAGRRRIAGHFTTEGFGRAYVVDRHPDEDVCCRFESKNPSGGADVGAWRCSKGADAEMQSLELSFPKVDLRGTWGHFHLVCTLPPRHDGRSSQLRTYRVYQRKAL